MQNLMILSLMCLIGAAVLPIAANAKPRQQRIETITSQPNWHIDHAWNAREERRHERSRRFIENSGAAMGLNDEMCDSSDPSCLLEQRPRRRRR